MDEVTRESELRTILDAARPLGFERSAASQVYDRVRDAIVCLRLPPGARLSEIETARALEASRTPVREAFIRLADVGLLEVRPNRGTFVAKLDPHRMLEARFIREALEVAVATRLAEGEVGVGQERFVEECRALLARMEALAGARDPIGFNDADDAFHRRLGMATGYARVAASIAAEEAHGVRIRLLSLRDEEAFARIVAEHRAILAAIAAGDGEGAARAVRTHLRNVHRFIAEASAAHPEFFTQAA